MRGDQGSVIRSKVTPSGGLGGLVCNSLVFTWGFVEMLGWFWVSVYVSIPCFLGLIGSGALMIG